METNSDPKIDKRTKEYKTIKIDENTPALTFLPQNWEVLKNAAIPVKEAVFHRTVKSWNGEPETAFYATGGKPSRTATMWYSPCGLLCEQAKGKKLIIPLANVVYTVPL